MQQRLAIRVRNDEVDALKLGFDHVVDSIAACATDAKHLADDKGSRRSA